MENSFNSPDQSLSALHFHSHVLWSGSAPLIKFGGGGNSDIDLLCNHFIFVHIRSLHSPSRICLLFETCAPLPSRNTSIKHRDLKMLPRSLGNGVRKNGVRNRVRIDDVGSILKFPFGENSAGFAFWSILNFRIGSVSSMGELIAATQFATTVSDSLTSPTSWTSGDGDYPPPLTRRNPFNFGLPSPVSRLVLQGLPPLS